MSHYYNEFNRSAAAWLGQLIADGLMPAGSIDERSISNVKPDEIRNYRQCHFFAGIGGWAEALRIAGWPDDRPVWTGSCSCQPFSSAGKQKGTDDARHMWPEFRRLIAECKPPIIFGEQVASKLGREWLVGVRADLEALGYAVGAADLCAAGIGAPHIRQRLYWMAYAGHDGRTAWGPRSQHESKSSIGEGAGSDREAFGLDNSTITRFAGDGQRREVESARHETRMLKSTGSSPLVRMGSPIRTGLQRFAGDGDNGNQPRRIDAQPNGSTAETGGDGFWSAFEIIPCRDGKSRRIEPGTFPLAHGVQGRVGLLRGYGNAIVPQVAAEFIKAAMFAPGINS